MNSENRGRQCLDWGAVMSDERLDVRSESGFDYTLLYEADLHRMSGIECTARSVAFMSLLM